MTARKTTAEAPTGTDTAGTVPDGAETVTATADSGPDLANVNVGVEGATGTPVDVLADNALVEVDADAFSALKALGNANADVNVTAVQNGHGLWTWTARAAEDGRKLAAGGPHHADRLVENLTVLFTGGQTVALHATGLAKAKRLA